MHEWDNIQLDDGGAVIPRRSFLNFLGYMWKSLPTISSIASVATWWLYETGLINTIFNAWEKGFRHVWGENAEQIIEAIPCVEIPVRDGVPMTFVWIAHIPSRASIIREEIDQILKGQSFDAILTEGNLEDFLPDGLREHAIDVDRWPATIHLLFLISVINFIICYKLKIGSDSEEFINRRLVLMYLLTTYNFVPPLEIINMWAEVLPWDNPASRILSHGYVRDGRSLLMLRECLKYAWAWKKVLFLSGRLHIDDAEWYSDHPWIHTIKEKLASLMYGWLHDAWK